MTYSAINIGNLATSTTDHMMVVVAHTAFVKSRGTNGLNATNDASFGQQGECVIHGLTRNSANVGLGLFSNYIGRAVWKSGDCAHHSKSLCCDMEAVGSQYFGEICMHEGECSKVWTYIKF